LLNISCANLAPRYPISSLNARLKLIETLLLYI